MAKTRAARSLARSGSSVTQTGRMHTTRGLGRPAASAAAVITGTMWSRTVPGPVIHNTVPSVCSPARRSICGPSAATTTGTRPGDGVVSPMFARTVVPLNAAGCLSSSGSRTARYSRMCRIGRLKS